MTRFTDLLTTLVDDLNATVDQATDLLTPTLRLGVTGLARSGKTVFITALVRALTGSARLPFFAPAVEGRILRAYLEPQPDDALPRFEFESHVATLTGTPPSWPDGTRRISQLRVTIEYESRSAVRRWFGPSRLHVDIIDYPGEWLLDLALLDRSYEAWCADTLAVVTPDRGEHTAPFLAFLSALESRRSLAEQPLDLEQTALQGAKLYRALLLADRADAEAEATLGPGRFLMPGDLEGSPLLTFFPLREAVAPGSRPSPLHAFLARRYDSYRSKVVQPFFREHFARLDRQIVLVDALGAINRGAAAMADLDRALTSVMKAFRPGTAPWLQVLVGARIDRVVFAATKADHLHHVNHDRLEAIMKLATQKAGGRATTFGAEVSVLALAAIRATREAEVVEDRQTLPLIVGIPMPGERVGGNVFDGVKEAAVFPGDLPLDPAQAFDPGRARADANAFVRFRPPALSGGVAAVSQPLPHIRLDRALQFLLGDKLA